MTVDAKGPTKVDILYFSDGAWVGDNKIYFKNGKAVCCEKDRNEHGSLIADAFNVYSETGLTPREILRERDRTIKVYAHHKTGCDAEGLQECDCGLSDLLKELEGFR